MCSITQYFWEMLYIHEDGLDKLVHLALIHAEFESLHPFFDGNGRLGRMLIPLFLYNNGLMGRPTFYISEELEKQKETYYGSLRAISRDDNWTDWYEFFLRIITLQAKTNLIKGRNIHLLYEKLKSQAHSIVHSQFSIQALDYIFKHPIFKSSDFAKNADIHEKTARRILNAFRDNGIVRVLRKGRGRQATTLLFPELLNTVEGKEAF